MPVIHYSTDGEKRKNTKIPTIHYSTDGEKRKHTNHTLQYGWRKKKEYQSYIRVLMEKKEEEYQSYITVLMEKKARIPIIHYSTDGEKRKNTNHTLQY